MRRILAMVTVLTFFLMLSPAAFATNGTALIGVGPIARAMGGVGIAAPQDAISAVFANPAAMCFGPYCPSSEFNFAGTLFAPEVDAKVSQGGTLREADSDEKIYTIPAIGISAPLSEGPRPWRFGIAAYGVSGLGVDYRNSVLDDGTVAGTYTQLQIMKFAPAVAYQPFPTLSVGVAIPVDFGNLDLQNGSSFNYGIGAQVGLIYMPTDKLSLGFNYISPVSVDYKNVVGPIPGVTTQSSDLELESPQQIGLGVAYTFFDNALLLEVDGKWINWADAEGYGKDGFDWDNQWVVALGAQWEVIPKLFLRAGYNYGENPVKERNGWSPAGVTNVQGIPFPDPLYEEFRIIGFPAFVEHHITFGVGYEFSDKFSMNLGYMHAFDNSVSETGTGFFGPETIESTLSESSLDFGLTWRF